MFPPLNEFKNSSNVFMRIYYYQFAIPSTVAENKDEKKRAAYVDLN